MRVGLNVQKGVSVTVGLAYGLGLTLTGSLLAGAGHGTYLLLGIASAPVSFLGFIPSIGGPPVLWSAVGALLPYTGRKPQRQVLFGIMLLHYLGVALVPFFDEFAEWKYFERVWEAYPVVVLMGGSLYLVGQIAIWFCWLGNETRDQIK